MAAVLVDKTVLAALLNCHQRQHTPSELPGCQDTQLTYVYWSHHKEIRYTKGCGFALFDLKAYLTIFLGRLTKTESKGLCKLIDCQKLSQETSNHASQNDRLSIQIVVRVLYLQQLRLKSDLSGNSGDGSFSQRMINNSVPSVVVCPKDNYASLRRENCELKLEIQNAGEAQRAREGAGFHEARNER